MMMMMMMMVVVMELCGSPRLKGFALSTMPIPYLHGPNGHRSLDSTKALAVRLT